MRIALQIAMALALGVGCNQENFSGGAQRSGDVTRKPAPKPESDTDDKDDGKKKKPSKDDGDQDEGDLGSSTPAPDDADVADGRPAEIVEDEAEFACDKGKAGLVGKVYQLAPNTSSLPNLDAMTPIGQVEALQLDVPTRKFETGFPGVPNLIEWFAIAFFAQLEVPEDGVYQFMSKSDDGSKIYIGKELVLNHDGIHSPVEKVSGPVELKKGKRRIKIEWFQGPRVLIALQIYWKRPGAAGFEILPATVLTHGKDCNLKDLGDFD